MPQVQSDRGSSDSRPESQWKSWCRLCAKSDPTGNVEVFSKGENGVIDTALATAIGKYFWVNISATDGMPQCLCWECHVLVNALVNFTDRVNKVQSMLCTLKATNMADPNNLRIQYGLYDEDRQHIIKPLTTEMDGEHVGPVKNLEDETNEEILEEIAEEDCDYVPEEEGEQDDADEYEVSFEFADEEIPEMRHIMISADGVEDTSEKAPDKHEGDSELYEHFKYKAGEVVPVPRDSAKDGVIIETINGIFDEEEMLLEVEEEDIETPVRPVEAEESVRRPKQKPAQHQPAAEGEPPVKRRRGRPSKYPELPTPDTEAAVNSEPIPMYSCSLCNKSYKNLTSYRKHVTEVHQLEPDVPEYNCSTCGKTFPTERQLGAHVQIHLPLEVKLNVPCPYCDKKFSKVAVMRQHVNGIHYQEKPFICDECGRPLKTLAALNEHKLVHTTECPFECDVCGKRFKNKPRLKVHYDTHTETTYTCSECGMQLNTRRTLKMHMLVHSDNRRYKCDFCGTEFKRSKALKNHLILHTGMRPYKCTFCDKSFTNGSNCRSHKKKAHAKELAEEEAKGVKMQPTVVPKLADLRSGQNLIDVSNPITKKGRKSGGLSNRTRAMLIAADGRKQEEAADSSNDGVSTYVQLNEDGTAVVSDSLQRANGQEGDFDDETVIYEIIDEI